MDIKSIIIDKGTIKALSVKSRLEILELLGEKPKTLSMLSEELSLKPSTVSQHLKELENSGLIEKEKTDRKWKFYNLTRKAKRILTPLETKVVFTLFSGLFLSFISTFMILKDKVATSSAFATKNMAVMEATTNLERVSVSAFNWSYLLYIGIIVIILAVAYTMIKINIIKKLEDK